MDKIKIPQVLVSYANGTGGEWLAYQIGQHEKYYKHHEGEMEGWKNEYNRWRITPSWRQMMCDDTDVKKFWLEKEYDGSPEWWQAKSEHESQYDNMDEYYQKVRDMQDKKARWRIPVHRVHEAWQDMYWKDLFEEFKVVSIHLNKKDYTALSVMQSNVIKKIWWQDLSNPEDLFDELRDKCKKHKADFDAVMTIINRFSGSVNYTDMMLALNLSLNPDEPEEVVDTMWKQIGERWNDYNIEQHIHKLPCDHLIIDFGKFFVNRDYEEYKKLCFFLGMAPYDKEIWDDIIFEYMNDDVGTDQMIFLDEVTDRLWQRVAEAYEYE